MKKIISVLLAALLVLALCTAAFAEDTPLDISDHSFTAYQIFSGTQTDDPDDDTIAAIGWGSGIDAEAFLTALKASSDFGTTNPFAAIAYDEDDPAASAKAVAAVVSSWTDDSANAKAFAKLADANKTGDGKAVKDGDVLNAGYYLVVDTTATASNPKAYNLSLLQLTKKGTFEIESKVSVPTVDKTVKTDVLSCTKLVETSTDYDATHEHTADCYDVEWAKSDKKPIGGVEYFKIVATVPESLEDYTNYFFTINDTLLDGLTFNNDIVVTIGGEDADETTDYTKTVNDDSFAVSLVNAKDHGGETVVVTYSATVNSDAVIGSTGNPNEATVKYSNNPNYNYGTTPTTVDPMGETPKSTTVTYTTQIKIVKKDNDNKVLTDAEFTLSGTTMKKVLVYKEYFVEDEAGTFYKLTEKTPNGDDQYTATTPTAETASKYVSTETKYKKESKWVEETLDGETSLSAFVDGNGTVEFRGLDAGTYTLTESKVPSGYNPIDPIEFEIKWTAPTDSEITTASKCTWAVETEDDVTFDATNGTISVTILNQKGSTLPETGGMGTTIFYIVGSVLVVGAAILLITKKRMRQEDI